MDEGLVKIRHERSKRDFPGVRLEEDEYVEFAFSRARVCLWLILGGVATGLVLILLAFLLVLMGQGMIDETGRRFLFIILFALLAAALVTCIVSSIIYHGNKLFITNKRAIQMITISPVINSVNVIDLTSVEDVSFKQSSLLQRIFHYGTLRLSTVGDETTYTFKFSDISGEDLKAVTKLVSDAKKKDKKAEED